MTATPSSTTTATARRRIGILIAFTFISWLGQRLTQIAFPLVALRQTGDPWTTGLVAGAAGLPVLLAPWWARHLRERITSGRTLAAVVAVQVGGMAVVPIAASTIGVNIPVLVASGLMIGSAVAIASPALRAILSDIADEISPSSAASALAWQDFAHRVTLIFAPPLGAWAVTLGQTMPLLWSETVLLGAATALLLFIPAVGSPAVAAPPRVWETLRRYPDVTRLIGANIAVGFAWFSFALGLAIWGEQVGQPGVIVAAGLSGYGIGSVAASLLAPLLIARLPIFATALAGWSAFGASLVAVPLVIDSTLWVAVVSLVGGAGIPFGVAARNRLISTTTTGADRRAAFAVDSTAYSSANAAGMLVGGAIIGNVGVPASLWGCGTLVLVATFTIVGPRTLRR